MSSHKRTGFRCIGWSGLAVPFAIVGVAVLAAGCSNNVSRFDYPSFASGGSDGVTTGSINPVPTEPIYGGGATAANASVVRQDLAPPEPQNYAAAQPTQLQPAPLPPRTTYPAARFYQPPPQASYQRPTPVAPKPAENKTVRVKNGDTLYKLASEHNVTIEEIKTANNLRDTRLSIGQKLIIPVDGVPVAPVGPPVTYKVEHGDSLSKIAHEQNVSQEKLIALNDLKRPYTLRLGQTLKIPGKPVMARKKLPVRVASNNPNMPLPSTNSARGGSSGAVAPKTTLDSTRPQQRVAARTENLPKPEPMAGNQFRWPAKGRIIAKFGPRENGKHNDGINVAVPKDASVKAAENGVVAYAGSELEPYGNLILVRHANNWVTAYAHNDELLVKRGDTVRRGQIIAKAGQSGNVSQPQLHFELRKGSKPVDPLSYMANGS